MLVHVLDRAVLERMGREHSRRQSGEPRQVGVSHAQRTEDPCANCCGCWAACDFFDEESKDGVIGGTATSGGVPLMPIPKRLGSVGGVLQLERNELDWTKRQR